MIAKNVDLVVWLDMIEPQWLNFAVTREMVPGTKTGTGIFEKQ